MQEARMRPAGGFRFVLVACMLLACWWTPPCSGVQVVKHDLMSKIAHQRRLQVVRRRADDFNSLQSLSELFKGVAVKDPKAALAKLLSIAKESKLLPQSVQAAFSKLATIQGKFGDLKFQITIDGNLDAAASWTDGIKGELSIHVKLQLELTGSLAQANKLAALFCYQSPAGIVDLKFSLRAKLADGFEMTTLPTCTVEIVDLAAAALPSSDSSKKTDASADASPASEGQCTKIVEKLVVQCNEQGVPSHIEAHVVARLPFGSSPQSIVLKSNLQGGLDQLGTELTFANDEPELVDFSSIIPNPSNPYTYVLAHIPAMEVMGALRIEPTKFKIQALVCLRNDQAQDGKWTVANWPPADMSKEPEKLCGDQASMLFAVNNADITMNWEASSEIIQYTIFNMANDGFKKLTGQSLGSFEDVKGLVQDDSKPDVETEAERAEAAKAPNKESVAIQKLNDLKNFAAGALAKVKSKLKLAATPAAKKAAMLAIKTRTKARQALLAIKDFGLSIAKKLTKIKSAVTQKVSPSISKAASALRGIASKIDFDFTNGISFSNDLEKVPDFLVKTMSTAFGFTGGVTKASFQAHLGVSSFEDPFLFELTFDFQSSDFKWLQGKLPAETFTGLDTAKEMRFGVRFERETKGGKITASAFASGHLTVKLDSNTQIGSGLRAVVNALQAVGADTSVREFQAGVDISFLLTNFPSLSDADFNVDIQLNSLFSPRVAKEKNALALDSTSSVHLSIRDMFKTYRLTADLNTALPIVGDTTNPFSVQLRGSLDLPKDSTTTSASLVLSGQARVAGLLTNLSPAVGDMPANLQAVLALHDGEVDFALCGVMQKGTPMDTVTYTANTDAGAVLMDACQLAKSEGKLVAQYNPNGWRAGVFLTGNVAQSVFATVFPKDISSAAKLRVLQAHISTMPDQAVEDLPAVFTNPELESGSADATADSSVQADDLNVQITNKFLKRGASFHALITIDSTSVEDKVPKALQKWVPKLDTHIVGDLSLFVSLPASGFVSPGESNPFAARLSLRLTNIGEHLQKMSLDAKSSSAADVNNLMKAIRTDEKSHLSLLVTFERTTATNDVTYGVTVEADTSLTMTTAQTSNAKQAKQLQAAGTDRLCSAIQGIAAHMQRFGWNAPPSGSKFDARLILALNGDANAITSWSAKLGLEAVAGATAETVDASGVSIGRAGAYLVIDNTGFSFSGDVTLEFGKLPISLSAQGSWEDKKLRVVSQANVAKDFFSLPIDVSLQAIYKRTAIQDVVHNQFAFCGVVLPKDKLAEPTLAFGIKNVDQNAKMMIAEQDKVIDTVLSCEAPKDKSDVVIIKGGFDPAQSCTYFTANDESGTVATTILNEAAPAAWAKLRDFLSGKTPQPKKAQTPTDQLLKTTEPEEVKFPVQLSQTSLYFFSSQCTSVANDYGPGLGISATAKISADVFKQFAGDNKAEQPEKQKQQPENEKKDQVAEQKAPEDIDAVVSLHHPLTSSSPFHLLLDVTMPDAAQWLDALFKKAQAAFFATKSKTSEKPTTSALAWSDLIGTAKSLNFTLNITVDASGLSGTLDVNTKTELKDKSLFGKLSAKAEKVLADYGIESPTTERSLQIALSVPFVDGKADLANGFIRVNLSYCTTKDEGDSSKPKVDLAKSWLRVSLDLKNVDLYVSLLVPLGGSSLVRLNLEGTLSDGDLKLVAAADSKAADLFGLKQYQFHLRAVATRKSTGEWNCALCGSVVPPLGRQRKKLGAAKIFTAQESSKISQALVDSGKCPVQTGSASLQVYAKSLMADSTPTGKWCYRFVFRVQGAMVKPLLNGLKANLGSSVTKYVTVDETIVVFSSSACPAATPDDLNIPKDGLIQALSSYTQLKGSVDGDTSDSTDVQVPAGVLVFGQATLAKSVSAKVPLLGSGATTKAQLIGYSGLSASDAVFLGLSVTVSNKLDSALQTWTKSKSKEEQEKLSKALGDVGADLEARLLVFRSESSAPFSAAITLTAKPTGALSNTAESVDTLVDQLNAAKKQLADKASKVGNDIQNKVGSNLKARASLVLPFQQNSFSLDWQNVEVKAFLQAKGSTSPQPLAKQTGPKPNDPKATKAPQSKATEFQLYAVYRPFYSNDAVSSNDKDQSPNPEAYKFLVGGSLAFSLWNTRMQVAVRGQQNGDSSFTLAGTGSALWSNIGGIPNLNAQVAVGYRGGGGSDSVLAACGVLDFTEKPSGTGTLPLYMPAPDPSQVCQNFSDGFIKVAGVKKTINNQDCMAASINFKRPGFSKVVRSLFGNGKMSSLLLDYIMVIDSRVVLSSCPVKASDLPEVVTVDSLMPATRAIPQGLVVIAEVSLGARLYSVRSWLWNLRASTDQRAETEVLKKFGLGKANKARFLQVHRPGKETDEAAVAKTPSAGNVKLQGAVTKLKEQSNSARFFFELEAGYDPASTGYLPSELAASIRTKLGLVLCFKKDKETCDGKTTLVISEFALGVQLSKAGDKCASAEISLQIQFAPTKADPAPSPMAFKGELKVCGRYVEMTLKMDFTETKEWVPSFAKWLHVKELSAAINMQLANPFPPLIKFNFAADFGEENADQQVQNRAVTKPLDPKTTMAVGLMLNLVNPAASAFYFRMENFALTDLINFVHRRVKKGTDDVALIKPGSTVAKLLPVFNQIKICWNPLNFAGMPEGIEFLADVTLWKLRVMVGAKVVLPVNGKSGGFMFSLAFHKNMITTKEDMKDDLENSPSPTSFTRGLWNSTVGGDLLDDKPRVMAVQDCASACRSNKDCIGFDYGFRDGEGMRCHLMKPSKTPRRGSANANLYEESCDSDYFRANYVSYVKASLSATAGTFVADSAASAQDSDKLASELLQQMTEQDYNFIRMISFVAENGELASDKADDAKTDPNSRVYTAKQIEDAWDDSMKQSTDVKDQDSKTLRKNLQDTMTNKKTNLQAARFGSTFSLVPARVATQNLAIYQFFQDRFFGKDFRKVIEFNDDIDHQAFSQWEELIGTSASDKTASTTYAGKVLQVNVLSGMFSKFLKLDVDTKYTHLAQIEVLLQKDLESKQSVKYRTNSHFTIPQESGQYHFFTLPFLIPLPDDASTDDKVSVSVLVRIFQVGDQRIPAPLMQCTFAVKTTEGSKQSLIVRAQQCKEINTENKMMFREMAHHNDEYSFVELDESLFADENKEESVLLLQTVVIPAPKHSEATTSHAFDFEHLAVENIGFPFKETEAPTLSFAFTFFGKRVAGSITSADIGSMKLTDLIKKMLVKSWDAISTALKTILDYLANPSKIWKKVWSWISRKKDDNQDVLLNALTEFKKYRSGEAMITQLTARGASDDDITEATEILKSINQYGDRDNGGMGWALRTTVDSMHPGPALLAVRKMFTVWDRFVRMNPLLSYPNQPFPSLEQPGIQPSMLALAGIVTTSPIARMTIAEANRYTNWLDKVYARSNKFNYCKSLWLANIISSAFALDCSHGGDGCDYMKDEFKIVAKQFLERYQVTLPDLNKKTTIKLESFVLFQLDDLISLRKGLDTEFFDGLTAWNDFQETKNKKIRGGVRMLVDRARCTLRTALDAVELHHKKDRVQQHQFSDSPSFEWKQTRFKANDIPTIKQTISLFLQEDNVQTVLWAHYRDLKQLSDDLARPEFMKDFDWTTKKNQELLRNTLGK